MNIIPDIANPATKAALNPKDTESENEIPDTAGFIATPKFNRFWCKNKKSSKKDLQA